MDQRRAGPVGRLSAVARGAGWGLTNGLVSGAVGGTVVVPAVGTLVGAVIGIVVASAVVPFALLYLYVAARPGTDRDRYRRRSRGLCVGLGVAVVAVGPIAMWRSGDVAHFQVGSVVALCMSLALLVPADRSLRAVEPAAAGSAEPGLRLGIAVLLVPSLAIWSLVAWDKALGPDARGRRAAVALRDEAFVDLGYTQDRSSQTLEMGWGGCDDAPVAEAYAEAYAEPVANHPSRAARDGVARLERLGGWSADSRRLDPDTFTVSAERGDDSLLMWLYGDGSGTSVQVLALVGCTPGGP